MNKKRKPLELYVHIPFCIRKCAYCDFVSGPGTKAMQKEYEAALLAEIDAAEETAESEVISAFFGGGTPSAVDAGMLARVMEKLRSKYIFSEDAEITLEANPGTLDAEKLKCYRKGGFNRISIGCQSVHDAEYGFFQYEISNYAKPGFACRHNIGYWKRTDYLGFGPSAASLFGNRRWTNTADRSLYLKACGALEKIREDEEILSRQDAMEEFMFLGLRMTQGISTTEFEEKFGKEIHAVYGGVLKKYEAMHLLQEHSGRLALTRDGISVSNVILADFLL